MAYKMEKRTLWILCAVIVFVFLAVFSGCTFLPSACPLLPGTWSRFSLCGAVCGPCCPVSGLEASLKIFRQRRKQARKRGKQAQINCAPGLERLSFDSRRRPPGQKHTSHIRDGRKIFPWGGRRECCCAPAGANQLQRGQSEDFLDYLYILLNSGDTLVAMDDYIVLAPDKIQCAAQPICRPKSSGTNG